MEKLEYLLTWTNVPQIERRPGRTIQAWRLKTSICFILDSCFYELYVRRDLRKISEKRNCVIPARLELATFRVLGGRDNHYTTESRGKSGEFLRLIDIIKLDFEKCVENFRCFYISNSLLTTAYINCRWSHPPPISDSRAFCLIQYSEPLSQWSVSPRNFSKNKNVKATLKDFLKYQTQALKGGG